MKGTGGRFCVNMGLADRVIRSVVSASLLWVLFGTDWLKDEALLIVAVGLFTVTNVFAVSTGRCPMYYLTGTSTRSDAP